MKTLILTFFIFLNTCLFAQIWQDNLYTTNPKATPQEKSVAFKAYKKTNKYVKGNGFNPYERELYFSLKRSSSTSSFQPTALFTEWEKEQKKQLNNKSLSNANWIAKGPINTPIILSNGKKRGNGRINCIAFDPYDENIIWVGSPAGGLWKTEDGGSNWTTETDNLPVIGVSHIAIDPNNTQVMYIVTGDANASDTYSIGVLKSIDGGVSWSTTGISYNITQEKLVNKIIINPNYSDSLYAVTNSAILISSDGGTTFNSTGLLGRWRDIEFKPGDPSTIYAAKQSSGGSDVYRSVDGGSTWNVINNGAASTGKFRPLIAVTPDNPNVIYAVYSAADYSFHGLYKSSDCGDSWVLQSDSPNILAWETDGSGTGGQSWYDLSLGVATNNENIVYVGGVNIWKSTNSGIDWDIDASSGNGSNYSYMHVDQHAFEFNPLNNIAYAGNDGGFYKYMESLNTWVDMSDGLEISQFYKLGLSKSNPNKLVAGAQDNGTEMLTNSTWDAIRGADGMECAIDDYDEDVIYSSSQYGGMKKSFNGGNNWSNIKPVNYSGGWVTPYKIHPNNPDLIVAGYDEVYRSLTAAANWDSVSYNVSGGQSIKTIALAPSNQNYIYAATYSTLKVTTDAGLSWTSIKAGLPNYNITDVVVSSVNPDHLWVTFSEYSANHKVYESTDRGTTWNNITGNNLPNLPVNCIVYQGMSNEELYIGTDIGVYFKDNSMSDWAPFMAGLPNVIVRELEIHYEKGTICAATYGRGIWESPLNSLPSSVLEEKRTFSIHPNPAKNNVIISAFELIKQKNFLNCTIYAVTGQAIINKQIKNPTTSIDISMLKKGCYIVTLSDNQGNIIREKLIKE